MPSPRRKQVTDEVFARIIEALELIAADDTRPRTKREIERASGLGHDTVARAFRQDAAEQNSYRINDKLGELIEPGSSGRRSPIQDDQLSARQEIKELKQRIAEMNLQLDRFAMASYAFYVAAQQQSPSPDDPIPIGRNRRQTR